MPWASSQETAYAHHHFVGRAGYYHCRWRGLPDRSPPALILRSFIGIRLDSRLTLTVRRTLPVFPHEQTSAAPVGMSQRCHNRTHAPQQTARYSITSSASCKNDSRSERPRALAVLRLTTSSNLTGDCAGKLPGGSPLRTRSTYEAERRKISAPSGP